MRMAISSAQHAEPDVPVGALLVSSSGEVLASAHNLKERKNDPTSHAELEVIRQFASGQSDWRLSDLTLVVTLEPCVMCAGAIVAARIPRVVFGAWDAKAGAGGSLFDILRDPRLGRPIEVFPGVLEAECAELLSSFFSSQRNK